MQTGTRPARARILLLADYFGRDRATGAKRANAFARHWARVEGISVDVVTARKPHFPLDLPDRWNPPPRVREHRVYWLDLLGLQARLRSDAAKTPPEGESEKARAGTAPPPAWRRPLRFLSELAVLTDRHTLWAPFGLFRAMLLPRPDVVVATAPSFVNLVMGALLAHLRRVPFVADLRDPWLTNPFRPKRTGLLARLDRGLERFALGSAREIWVTTDLLERELHARKDLDFRAAVRVLSNGYDEEEWRGVEPAPSRGAEIVVLHTGTLYGVRTPLPFLEDLASLRRSIPSTVWKRIRVRLVGPLEDRLCGEVEATIARKRLKSKVSLEPAVSAAEAIRLQAGADLLLLIGHRSREPASQVPLKLYEYLRAGKPQLAYFQEDSAVAELARAHPGLGIRVADLDDAIARRAALRAALLGAFEGEAGPVASEVGRFERKAIAAAALSRILELLPRSRASAGRSAVAGTPSP